MTHSLLTLSYCRCDPFGSAHFSTRTADAKFQIMWTFSSNHTHCPLTVDVALLILYTFPSNCTTFCSHRTTFSWYCTLSLCVLQMWHSSYCRFSPHTTHIVFLQQMFPIFFHCLSTTDVQFLHCTLSSCCRCDPPGTGHILYWYYRCDIPHNEDFLFTPHTLSSYYRCNPPDTVHSLYTLQSLLLVLQMRPSWYCTLSLLVLQM